MKTKFSSLLFDVPAGRFLPALLTAALLAFPTGSRADYTATVNPNSVIVSNFLGWGVSLAWWANVTGGYPNRVDYANLAFTQLKLNIVRYNIGGVAAFPAWGEKPSVAKTFAHTAALSKKLCPNNYG